MFGGKTPCDQPTLLLAPLGSIVPRMTDTRRALLRKLENVEAFPLIALQALPELRADLDAVEAEAADEAEHEVIDVRGPQTEHRGPEVDFRRPHTKS